MNSKPAITVCINSLLHSNALQTRIFHGILCYEGSSLIWVHIVCNIRYDQQTRKADEKRLNRGPLEKKKSNLKLSKTNVQLNCHPFDIYKLKTYFRTKAI